jgi:hypothetical protein
MLRRLRPLLLAENAGVLPEMLHPCMLRRVLPKHARRRRLHSHLMWWWVSGPEVRWRKLSSREAPRMQGRRMQAELRLSAKA